MILNDMKRRSGVLLGIAGQLLRLHPGVEFLGIEDRSRHTWIVGPYPVLTQGDVVDVKHLPNRVREVLPIHVQGELVQQEVRFESMGAA